MNVHRRLKKKEEEVLTNCLIRMLNGSIVIDFQSTIDHFHAHFLLEESNEIEERMHKKNKRMLNGLKELIILIVFDHHYYFHQLHIDLSSLNIVSNKPILTLLLADESMFHGPQ